jgi:hypothetical protein
MGSANTAAIDEYNLDNRGFWAVETEEVHACHAKLDHLIVDLDSNNNNEWEAFCTDIWGMEDVGNLDWARLDDQLAKEGEELNAEPIPHNAPHALTITITPEPHWAPDEEGYTPHIRGGHL